MLIALRAVLLVLFIAAPVGGHSPQMDLERLAADYAADPGLTRPVTFGVRVGDDAWTVSAVPAAGDEPARVTVTRGTPDVPAVVYVTDARTFARIASGKLQALTGMPKTRTSARAPFRVEPVNGLEMNGACRAAFLSAGFDFFATG